MTANLRLLAADDEQPADLTTIAGRMAHFREYLVRRQLSPATIRNYTNEAERAEKWCEQHGHSLRKVPGALFAEYVSLRPKSFASRNQLRAMVTHYWTLFERQDPPLWLVKVPRKPRMICRALDEDVAARLAHHARSRGDRAGLAVLLAMYQAFRREDIATMRWDDLREDGWISVHGKGDLPAKLPLHPVVKEALDKIQQHRTDDTWVFPGRALNSHVNPVTIWSWVHDVSEAAGVGKVQTHRLRHTALATANDGTGDLRATMDFARHSKADTTAGYTRSTERRLRAVIDAIRYEVGDSLTTDEPAGDVLDDPELRRLMETWLKLAPAARRFLNVTAEQIVASEG